MGYISKERTTKKKEMKRYIRLAVCLVVLVAGAHCWDDGECYYGFVCLGNTFNDTLIRVFI